MHGGITPELTHLSLIDGIPKPTTSDDNFGLMLGLLWSDPHKSHRTGFESDTEWSISDRNAGFLFGKKALDKCFADCGLVMIVRDHQVVHGGYDFFHDRKCVTIFSDTDYNDGKNEAAVLQMDYTHTVGSDPDNIEVVCKFLILNTNMKATTLIRSTEKEKADQAKNLELRNLLDSYHKKVI